LQLTAQLTSRQQSGAWPFKKRQVFGGQVQRLVYVRHVEDPELAAGGVSVRDHLKLVRLGRACPLLCGGVVHFFSIFEIFLFSFCQE